MHSNRSPISHSFHARCCQAAVLVAIAIPVFTNQFEKSREATDAANIHSAYAEVVVIAIDDPNNSSNTKVVSIVQKDNGWKQSDIKTGLIKAFGGSNNVTNISGVGSGKKATIAWNKTTSSAEGHTTLIIGD